jgi:hypothetical protein
MVLDIFGNAMCGSASICQKIERPICSKLDIKMFIKCEIDGLYSF